MDKNLEPRLSQRTKSRRARRLHRDTNPLSSTGPPSQSNGEEEIKTKEDERGLQKRIPCLDTLKLIDDAVLNRSQVYSSTSHNVKGASLSNYTIKTETFVPTKKIEKTMLKIIPFVGSTVHKTSKRVTSI